MKKKLLSCALFLGCLFAVSSCSSSINWVESDEEFEGYVNEEREYPPQGSLKDKITFDGIVDEAYYDQLHWFEKVGPDTGINVKMTATYDEVGLYFVFIVEDHNVYVNINRGSTNNTGVELYFCWNGSNNIESSGWEIDYNADGTVNSKLRIHGAYESVDGPYNMAPCAKVTVQGGELNTGNVDGYTVEAYMTWEFLRVNNGFPEPKNGESYTISEIDEIVDLRLNPTLLVMMSYATDAPRYAWDSFAEEYRADRGDTWSDPNTWYSFDKNGYVED